jgi:hypothetical protein
VWGRGCCCGQWPRAHAWPTPCLCPRAPLSAAASARRWRCSVRRRRQTCRRGCSRSCWLKRQHSSSRLRTSRHSSTASARW